MSDIYSSGPGYNVYDLIGAGAESVQLSADATEIYVAMNNGEIRVYDLATRSLQQTITVADGLGAMTLDTAGTTAYVIGTDAGSGSTGIYQVNLTTGASTALPLASGITPTDIAYMDGNRLLLSADQTYIYNLATQQTSTPTGTNPVGFDDPSVMVESDGLVLIGQTTTSSGPLELYDTTTGTVIGAGDSYQGGSPSGFNQGTQAVTREGGLVAQYIYLESIEIYDLSLNLVESLAGIGPFSGGLAFDSEGDFLLAYLPGANLTIFDTDSWNSSLIIDVRPVSSTYRNGGDGGAITVTPDDGYIILTDTQDGFVQIIELTAPLGSVSGVIGSNGNDSLTAVQGEDVDGRDGVDELAISFLGATTGVAADFRTLANSSTIVIEGATITNVENISWIDGSEFDDILAIYQASPNGNARIYGHGGNDEIYVSTHVGSFGPVIDGGAGDDTIDARGTAQGGDYFGGTGNDTIYTDFGGQAVAAGGDGHDTLHSWGNAYGEDGDDIIVMHRPIDISGATPRGYGGEGDDTISAILDFDNGSTLPTYHLAGEGGADTLIGSDANDYLTSVSFSGNGNSEEDTGIEQDSLSGGGGNDNLFAGYGDNVDGGDGDDGLTFSLGGATSGVTLNTDDFTAATPLTLGGGSIQNVERLVELYGSAFDDIITVGAGSALQSAAVQVHGRDGNDTFTDLGAYSRFWGDNGDDTFILTDASSIADFYGLADIDTADFSQYSLGLTVELSTNPHGNSGFYDNGSGDGILYEVENVEGTAIGDRIIGSNSDNTLNGYGGNDIIDGGYGNDILTGGDGVDEVQFLHGYNGVTVSLAITTAQNTGLGIDTLSGFENLTGSNYDDVLTGDDQINVILGMDGNDTLDGGAGADWLEGGSGHDTYHVDTQADLVVELASGGFDTVISAFDSYLDWFANVENLTLADGAGDLFGVGNQLNNTIIGNDGANLLIGGDGDDYIVGGAGVDYIFGETGNDTLSGGDDPDAIYGMEGDDTLSGGDSFHTDTLVGGIGNDILHGNSGLNDYDLMDGGEGDDSYYVDTGADLTFEAINGGTDTVYADVSNVSNAGVYLYANVENLVLLGTTAFGVGNELDNTLTGSDSANWLLGGAGNDLLMGGAGDDVLFGEAGADTFVFAQGSGGDVIGDFAAGEDVMDLSAFGFADFAALEANFIQNGNVGAINMGTGDFIVLHNVQMDQLVEGDFLI